LVAAGSNNTLSFVNTSHRILHSSFDDANPRLVHPQYISVELCSGFLASLSYTGRSRVGVIQDTTVPTF